MSERNKFKKMLIAISIFISLNILFVVAYIYYALAITQNSLSVFYSEIYLTILYLFFFITIFPAYYKKEALDLYRVIFHHSNDLVKLGSKLIFKGFSSMKLHESFRLFSQLYVIGASFFIVAGLFSFIAFPLSFFTTELQWWTIENIWKSLIVLPFLLILLSIVFLIFNRIVILILQGFKVIRK